MNIWVFVGIFLAATAAITATTLRGHGIWKPASVAAVMVVYIRGAHFLGPHVPFNHDAYFYFSSTEALLASGSTNPASTVFSKHLGEILLELPGLQTFTAFAMHVTGVDGLTPMQLVPPVLSLALFTGAWALYKLLLGARWGLLAAYLTSMLEGPIYWLTHYHQQGVGFIAIVFTLYFAFRLTGLGYHRVLLPGFVLIISFTAISHRFSSIVIALLVLIFVGALSAWEIIDSQGTFRERSAINIALLIAIVIPLVLIFFSQEFVRYIASLSISLLEVGFESPSQAPGVSSAGTSIIDRFPLLIKTMLAIVAAPTVFATALGRGPVETRWFVGVGGALGVIAIPIMALSAGTWARIVAFGYILIVPVSVYTLATRYKHAGMALRLFVASLFIIFVMLGVFAGMTPSLIDHDSDIRDDGFHGVDPKGKQSPAAGTFIDSYIPKDISIGTTVRTRMIPLYFGSHHESRYITEYQVGPEMAVYDSARELKPPFTNGQIYTNGRVLLTINRTE